MKKSLICLKVVKCKSGRDRVEVWEKFRNEFGPKIRSYTNKQAIFFQFRVTIVILKQSIVAKMLT